jgi:hypothetical protein
MSCRKDCFEVLLSWRSLILAVVLSVGLSVSGHAMAVEPSQPKDIQRTNQIPAGESNEDLSHRIKLLELKAADPGDSKLAKIAVPMVTAFIGFMAVLAAASLGMFGQNLVAKNAANIASDSLVSAAALAEKEATARAILADKEATARAELAKKAADDAATLARDAARYKHAEQMIEFNLRQIECFYAPMFAALRQSRTLYFKMLDQLALDEPDRYRINATASGDDFRLQIINEQGEAKEFYLVDQLPAIKGNASALQLVDLMLELGKTMCSTITTHAGLASEDLIEMLGIYMAHHAILSAIRNGPETTAFEPGHNKRGAFPFGLDDRIELRLKALSKEIDDYDKAWGRSLSRLANHFGEGA